MTNFIEHNYRYEVKFEVPALYYHMVDNKVKLHPYGFASHYSPLVSKMYFDTYDISCQKDGNESVNNKLKVQYRWYGNPKLIGQGKMRVKCDHNTLAGKIPNEMQELLYQQGNSSQALMMDRVNRQIPADTKQCYDKYPQSLDTTRYHRQYLMSRNGIRLTIDTDVQILPQSSQSTSNFWQLMRLPNNFTIELKFLAQHFTLISQVMCYLPLQFSSRRLPKSTGTTKLIHS